MNKRNLEIISALLFKVDMLGMSFSVGIVGLPNVGKSTLFKALTHQKVDISNYPFCTISPNVGIVQIPDERLEKIASIVKPEKTTPTVIEFVDIAGLVRRAHKGEGLGNQFLAHIREVDAILEVVRNFKDENIAHIEGGPDPERDIEIIKTELAMKDLETIEGVKEGFQKESRSGNKEAIKKLEMVEILRQKLNQEEFLSEIEPSKDLTNLAKELCLLTVKPIIYVFNINDNKEQKESAKKFKNSIAINLKTEEEISELSESEVKELELKSKVDELISLCYKILDLITFYTIKGGTETRAWTLKNGQNILDAAGKVHSDFREKFIKAEVLTPEKLIAASKEASLAPKGREADSWQNAKARGWVETVSKEYIVKDGDIIEFKI